MRNIIEVATGFQYSVNIGFDLNSDEKTEKLYTNPVSIKVVGRNYFKYKS